MPATQTSDPRPQVSPNSPKAVIWIINPFDQLPNETDVPLRYWALCRTFAEQGHEVIWWSSDFSHLTKSKRAPCPKTDGFAVRLIETPPYTKNISFARLKNHKAFADGFYADAMAGLRSEELKAPDRIVVSLPPLGIAESAFRIRDFVRESKCVKVGKYEGHEQNASQPEIPDDTGDLNTLTPSHLQTRPQRSCEVVVDIMDAWPETFYQLIPKPLRKALGPILLAPLHRSAKRAYQGADKISAVGQSYLDLASRYLDQKPDGARQCVDGEPKVCPQRSAGRLKRVPSGQLKEQTDPQTPLLDEEGCPTGGVVLGQSLTNNQQPTTPTHLCYHGTDLERFINQKTDESGSCVCHALGVLQPQYSETEDGEQIRRLKRTATPINHQQMPHSSLLTPHSERQPLSAVYLGSMGSGYDLQTIIDVAACWKTEGNFPFQIHFAGDGAQLEKLTAESRKLKLLDPEPSHFPTFPPSNSSKAGSPSLSGLSSPPSGLSIARVVFHGHLGKIAITDLLLSSDLALVPNRPDSLVACPYKAGEYAAAGLPMLSCLKGELGELLNQWNAGSEYNEGDEESLYAAFKKYSTDPDLLKHQSLNARNMAEALFDRTRTYSKLAAFIIN